MSCRRYRNGIRTSGIVDQPKFIYECRPLSFSHVYQACGKFLCEVIRLSRHRGVSTLPTRSDSAEKRSAGDVYRPSRALKPRRLRRFRQDQPAGASDLAVTRPITVPWKSGEGPTYRLGAATLACRHAATVSEDQKESTGVTCHNQSNELGGPATVDTHNCAVVTPVLADP